MKKLYRKGTVHPSPPFISDQLAFLPATILTLTAALSFEDREVLAYLLSCSVTSGNFSGQRRNNNNNNNNNSSSNRNNICAAGGSGGGDHPPSFKCSCFRCYMSYWIRWDSSSNRQLIHEIIDAFEDGLTIQSSNSNNNNKVVKNRKGVRRSKKGGNRSGELNRCEMSEFCESESVEDSSCSNNNTESVDNDGCDEEDENCYEDGVENKGGSVRKFVSFIGERIWSVWT